MFFAVFALLPLAVAAPLFGRQQVVPDLPPQANLADASAQILYNVGHSSGRYQNYNHIGVLINDLVPVADTLDQTIGPENVLAIDVLADKLCIAGQNEGSACNELIAYAYAWYRVQKYGKTYRELAVILGPNNIKTLNDDLNVLCFGSEGGEFNHELCQKLLEDVDVLANTIVGENKNFDEDNANSNTLEEFGLADLPPKPQTIQGL